MKKVLLFSICFVAIAMIMNSCEKEGIVEGQDVPTHVIDQLKQMGFNPDGIEIVEEGYRIERDIIITEEFLSHFGDEERVPNLEQYSTNNTVNVNGNGRNITVYAASGRKGYSAAMLAGLDEAIARYNSEGLDITFSRTTNKRQADIVMSRLSKRDERRGVLGSAGFPSNGDPYGSIKMSGVLESSYGLSTNGIATIIAHEMGHCIGLRHTDYFDRSISCGGGTSNEGAGSVGANHIPGTPTGATSNANSYMLSCTDGSNRPFNNDDKTALDYLY